MTAFDLVVIIIVGFAAVGGFMRGFVHEILALAAWIAAMIAISALHTPLTQWMLQYIDTQASAAVLAFAVLLMVPYLIVKLIARWAGSRARNSVLGAVDRMLGLGFGIVKGLIMVVLAFSVLVLGYDTIWGVEGRPDWIAKARSYSFVNAASIALVEDIEQRRAAFREQADDEDGEDDMERVSSEVDAATR
ncbi:CvpA family protein [Croceicoccus sp. YJ47]|uniref:CvpA family protein n=1 Tax=Croceicoccus sp. YJ47 TaxID=2798724 RepID=UPI001921BEDC|nr:CvpA family protein [Croceicoccus sp. YJ47]QQN74185.1 CvpA family protein [Croceicoccus sp. YJ47]